MPGENIFAAAIDDLFADPSIAADALWRAGGADPALPVRVIARLGDRITDFGDARFVSATAVLEVRVAEMPTPASGDTVETAGRLLTVSGRTACQRFVAGVDGGVPAGVICLQSCR